MYVLSYQALQAIGTATTAAAAAHYLSLAKINHGM